MHGSVGLVVEDGRHHWTFHAAPSATSTGFLCSADAWQKDGERWSKESEWRDAPPVLEKLLGEMFDQKPADALSWLHEATWRYYTRQTPRGREPLLRGGEELVVQLPAAAAAVAAEQDRSVAVHPRQEQPEAPPSMPMLQSLDDPPPAGGVDRQVSFESHNSEATSPHNSETSFAQRRRPSMCSTIGETPAEDSAIIEAGAPSGTVLRQPTEDRLTTTTECASAPKPSRSFDETETASATADRNRFAWSEGVDSGVLSPMSQIRLLWDCIFFLCLLYEMWATPLDFAFTVLEPPMEQRVVTYLVLSLFLLDIAMNFNTGYIEGDNLVMRRYAVARNYFIGWFWIDFLATVPDLIMVGVMSLDDQFSSVRVLRTMKFYKLLKALKLVRSVRLLRSQSMANKVLGHFNMSSTSMFFAQLVQGHIMLLILIHFNAVLWAACNPEWQSEGNTTFDMVLVRYGESMATVYRSMTFGDDLLPGSPSQEAVSVLVAIERATLFVLVSTWLIWRMLCVYATEASDRVGKEMVVAYLKHHRVSTSIQLKVFQTLNEASAIRRQQQHFRSLSSAAFPPQLMQIVCYELWGQRLMTLDIFLEIAKWEASFIRELAVVVYEQIIPAKVVLFSVGEPSDVAYLLLRGSLGVTYHEYEKSVPDFTPGMWVGEMALVNPRLRRSQTTACKVVSQLMVVPANEFQSRLLKFELKERFNYLLNERLWLGLCGRCGVLGDHYGSGCPSLRHTSQRKFIAANNPGNWAAGWQGAITRSVSQQRRRGLRSRLRAWWWARARRKAAEQYGLQPEHAVARSDLQQFLLAHRLGHLFIHMGRHGIMSLNDLKLASVEAMRADPEVHLTQDEERILSESAVNAFRRRMRRATTKMLESSEASHHFVFISHYKAEAGTTAALMQDMLVRMLKEHPNSVSGIMERPVFLDIEDLKDLSDLKRHVARSHNIVLLLTPGVLTRPWCLLEIVTAIRHKAHVLPVRVEEPGVGFEFPDDAWYERLLAGKILDRSCAKFLQSEGIDAADLEKALRQVFQRIAMPFSPQKTQNIRTAELSDLLKECRLRQGREQGSSRPESEVGVSLPAIYDGRESRAMLSDESSMPSETDGRNGFDGAAASSHQITPVVHRGL